MGTKYSNKASTCLLAHSHRSKLESEVCAILGLRQRAGEIELLNAEDHIYLTDARILYIPDFKIRVVSSGEIGWVEAKGFETPEWRIKRRLWLHYGPGFLEIWQGNYKHPKLTETLYPKAKKPIDNS